MSNRLETSPYLRQLPGFQRRLYGAVGALKN